MSKTNERLVMFNDAAPAQLIAVPDENSREYLELLIAGWYVLTLSDARKAQYRAFA